MRYLSVHDLVWLNSLLTGSEAVFDYQRLEECMAAQYGYGFSMDVLGQAASFLNAFCTKRPFAERNIETALVAFCTFLLANGWRLSVDDPTLASLVRGAWRGEAVTAETLRPLATADSSGGAGLRALVSRVCEERGAALQMVIADLEGANA